MCVICYKDKKHAMPTMDVIEDMWDTNPDGAGIMWRCGRRISFAKGFMKLENLVDFIDKHSSEFDGNEVALHFRIQTHGGKTAGNCHPFVVRRGTDVHSLNASGQKIVVMHNGVLPIIPRAKNISDTGELVLRASENKNPVKYLKSLNEFLKPSKVLVFTPDETLFLGAAFTEGKDGLLYSNLHHEYVYASSYYSKYGKGYAGKPYTYSVPCVTRHVNVWDDGYGGFYGDGYDEDYDDGYDGGWRTENKKKNKAGVPPSIPEYLIAVNEDERELAKSVCCDIAESHALYNMTDAEWYDFFEDCRSEIESVYYDEVDCMNGEGAYAEDGEPEKGEEDSAETGEDTKEEGNE